MKRVLLATWVVLIIYAVRQHRRSTRHNAGHARADSFHIDTKSHEINHMQIFMDKLGYILYSTRPSRQRGLESCSEVLCDVIRIGRVFGTHWCASSHRALQAIWQNYPAIAKHFADNITRLPFDGLHKILTIFSVLEKFGNAFGEVCEFSLAPSIRTHNTQQGQQAFETLHQSFSAVQGRTQRETHQRIHVPLVFIVTWCLPHTPK